MINKKFHIEKLNVDKELDKANDEV